MLRTITELVPHGNDALSKKTNVQYLANVGESSVRNNKFDYIISYFEKKSNFSECDIFLFKHIKNYDRNQSGFNMQKEIYKEDGWMSMKEFYKLYSSNEYFIAIADLMKDRAIVDLNVSYE